MQAEERLYLHLGGGALHAPEMAASRETLTACAVPAALSGHVAQIEVYRDEIDGVVFEQVVPDGAVRLIIDLGAARGEAWVAGATARPKRLRLEGAPASLTVTLRPGAAYEVLGVPAREIREQCVALHNLWPEEAASLRERLQAGGDDREVVTLVQSMLAARLARRQASDRRRSGHALRLLADGRRSVRETAAALGVGERRLQQIFEAEVGLTPRTYRRLARVHACLQSLRRSAPSRWPALALEHGFYDQAHLVNEFRAVVGLSPLAYLRSVAGSSKTAR